MKIYEVFLKGSRSGYVVVAKNEREAAEMVINYFKELPPFHFYETSDFVVRTIIDADKF